jgi:hypothetical protein
MPVIISGSTGISGTDGSASTPAVQGTDTNTGMFFPAADEIAFAEGGTEVMRIDASGRVGIGTSSPDYKLTIQTADAAISLKDSGGTTRAYIGVDGAFGSAPTGSLRFRSDQGGIVFGFAGTEQARLTTAGAFQVGNPSGTNASYTADRINFNSGSGYYVLNQSSVGVVLPNGNTSWSAQSDERLKDVVEPIEDAVAKVGTLRTVIGRYKTDDAAKRRSFLMAQDVQAVLPEAVTEGDDGHLLLGYSEVIPLLTAAIKELTAKLEAAEARIATLEAR